MFLEPGDRKRFADKQYTIRYSWVGLEQKQEGRHDQGHEAYWCAPTYVCARQHVIEPCSCVGAAPLQEAQLSSALYHGCSNYLSSSEASHHQLQEVQCSPRMLMY